MRTSAAMARDPLGELAGRLDAIEDVLADIRRWAETLHTESDDATEERDR